jgi:ABC-type nitrate/sulfonate/bicarbonate transport system substrate-binding protein
MMAASIQADWRDSLPTPRGRVAFDAPLGAATWFRVGGEAAYLLRPQDADDLAAFMASVPPELPVTIIGAASNLIIRDGGIPGTFTFPALMTTEKMIDESPNAVEGASRAIIRAQRELSADPDLATGVAKKLFPAMEAGLIAKLIARDAPFYDPTITEESVEGMNDFAHMSDLLKETTKYEDVVATRFSSLW